MMHLEIFSPGADDLDDFMFIHALAYLCWYAETHQYFTGGDVLEGFRTDASLFIEYNWRNKWGAVMTGGKNAGWYAKVGRIAPKSKQSHTGTLAHWRSRLYEGVDFGGKTTQNQLHDIGSEVRQGNIELIAGLWKAYHLGCESQGGGI